MTQKHTLGPWVILDEPNRHGSYLIYDKNEYGIGEAWNISEDIQNYANARLMAAAPDLLEACIQFVRKVECGKARSKKSYEQMKKAIAKAEGK